MSTLQIRSKNPPVNGKKDLIFLISLLDKEDKVEFVQEFSSDFEEMVQMKQLSKTGYYKLLKGYAPSDDRVLQVVEMDENAKKWIIERVKEKARKALEIIATIGEKDD
ncbi:hypothetical protein [Acidianus manzaensis]|uniref:Uncharacterized protein n=1 Tax=Acidianus manzaensis TaxID=282676 RepID=A0A1W6K0R7_9CREN|nr:hypothetical protein [Acidianus manzaensis]ARM76109.1 hypothetical protein B6F84_08790 [Acidianus manzaensis]